MFVLVLARGGEMLLQVAHEKLKLDGIDETWIQMQKHRHMKHIETHEKYEHLFIEHIKKDQ